MSEGQPEHRVELGLQDLLSSLDGVQAAVQPVENVKPFILSLWEAAQQDTSHDSPVQHARTVGEWAQYLKVNEGLASSATAIAIARIIFTVSILRQLGRARCQIGGEELTTLWTLVNSAIKTNVGEKGPLFSVQRSSQGFIAVPLCSVIENGDIQELWRLHVWLPDGERGNPLAAVHSHQTFVQSWILAGEGTDRRWNVEPGLRREDASHAEYRPAWIAAGGPADGAYKTHQTHSIVENTGKLVKATPLEPVTHRKDMSYVIPTAQHHTSTVAPDRMHATLCFFDAKRGFIKGAGVLGPVDGISFTAARATTDTSALDLADVVDLVRRWDDLIYAGRAHAQHARWEEALRLFDLAWYLCNTTPHFPGSRYARSSTLMELGNTERRFGRYQRALEHLQKALECTQDTAARAEISGELGVVHRQLNDLASAKHAFQAQLELAVQTESQQAQCRALGNLGMVNYQLYEQGQDTELLDLAISQLEERVKMSRALRRSNGRSHPPPALLQRARTWEAVGLNRLSLCYTARRDMAAALAMSSEAYEINKHSTDVTVQGISSFYRARAFLHNGQHLEARTLLNASSPCPAVIALCKEPSAEHRQYVQEAIAAGADLDIEDHQGYSPLDYAVFGSDAELCEILTAGLRDQLLSRRLNQAKLRKGYRELMQEHLRPALALSGDNSFWKKLRESYASGLAGSADNAALFDRFKVIPYAKFLEAGRIPRSDEGFAQDFTPELQIDFVVFFSYRWRGFGLGLASPDDAHQTQYRRMVHAINSLLDLNRTVVAGRLGIWLDYACVDQNDPAAGVAALPMNLAQCNAMIALVDDEYYTRAWCAVELDMIQTLRRSYSRHRLYQQRPVPGDAGAAEPHWTLAETLVDVEVHPSQCKLSVASDRDAIKFLERQQNLLGAPL